MDITFGNQQYLWLLFFIPLLIIIHFVSIKFRKKHALKFANFNSIARIKGIDLYSKNIVILGVSCLIIFLLAMSLAETTLNTSGQVTSFSFVITIDSSKSMEATDFSPNRITVAKQTAKNFVAFAPTGTQIGIVSFSGSSIIKQKMTDNKENIDAAINEINITFEGGTDVYNAISTSTNLISNEKNKAIILLSDGQTNIGTIADAIDYANKNNVIVHTIAMGTSEGSSTSYGLSKLDEQSLQAIAFSTGGKYFKAENAAELEKSFTDILDLKSGKISIDLSKYLLIAAAILFILSYLLSNTRFGTFP
jgi:Ca-activated chloride channel homolog